MSNRPENQADRLDRMDPFSLVEQSQSFSLILEVGEAPIAEDAVEASGHEPNGYFWEGVARRLVATEAPELAELVDYDPEGSMFVAYGNDRDALTRLGNLMARVANDADAMTALIEAAEADGFEFDD